MSKIRDSTVKIEAEFNGLPRRTRRRTFICNSSRDIVDEAKDEESNYWRLCSGDDLMVGTYTQTCYSNCAGS